MDLDDKFRGCLLGLATGDAVGTTVEFEPRGSFIPVSDMVGGGPFDLEPGEWTDDTSMALCLAASLVECGGFDAADQMTRYCRWRSSGYMSSTGYCFDIGNTVSSALRRFGETGDPYSGSTDPLSAGNGSIMRLAPIPMFYFPNTATAEKYAIESSRTTHGAAECIDASRLLTRILIRALAGNSKETILSESGSSYGNSPRIAAIAEGSYRIKHVNQIRGSG